MKVKIAIFKTVSTFMQTVRILQMLRVPNTCSERCLQLFTHEYISYRSLKNDQYEYINSLFCCVSLNSVEQLVVKGR